MNPSNSQMMRCSMCRKPLCVVLDERPVSRLHCPGKGCNGWLQHWLPKEKPTTPTAMFHVADLRQRNKKTHNHKEVVSYLLSTRKVSDVVTVVHEGRVYINTLILEDGTFLQLDSGCVDNIMFFSNQKEK